MLCVGPLTPDWTQSPPSSWHARSKRLRDSFSKYRHRLGIKSGLVSASESKETLVEEVANINLQTLAALGITHDQESDSEHPPILRHHNDPSPERNLKSIVQFQLKQPSEELLSLEPIASPLQSTAPANSSHVVIAESSRRAMSSGQRSSVLPWIKPRSKYSTVSSEGRSFVTAREGLGADPDSDDSNYSEADSNLRSSSSSSDEAPPTVKDRASAMFARQPTLLDEQQSVIRSVFAAQPENRHRLRARGRKLVSKGMGKILSKKLEGEILAAEKVLVLVKTSRLQALPHSFNDYEDNSSRVLERWKEYVLVARNTGREDAPLLLQFDKTRHINRVDTTMAVTASKIDVLLTPDMTFKFYSTLDKTITFWKSSSKGTVIYVLRPRSTESSLRWLALFLRMLGRKKAPTVAIGIPHMGLSLEVALPLPQIQKEQERLKAERGHGHPLINYQDMKSNVAHATPLMLYLYSVAVKLLGCSGYQKDEIMSLIGHNKLGLAWKRYDRLEWLDEEKEESIYYNWVLHNTHDLELRSKRPYSSYVTFENGVTMEEPPPIEGYLMRLTTWAGKATINRGLSKLFLKRMYFHTHDNLLFYTSAKHVIPPCPSAEITEKLRVIGEQHEGQDSLNAAITELFESFPLTYEVAPFKVNEKGEIAWLQGSSDTEKVKIHDFAALYEMERRASLVIEADGFLDMRDIKEIKRADGEDLLSMPLFFSARQDQKYDYECMFDVVMTSGTIIRFQAYNAQTRDAWVKRLQELVKYWKRHIYEDTARMNEVRQTNLAQLNVREGEDGIDAYIADAAPKWITAASLADPSIFAVVENSWSRSIHLHGELFQKSSKHASFRRYHVVLCKGHVILYALYNRSSAGKVKPDVERRWFKSIDLSSSSCYVYSGRITEGDLLQGRDKSFDTQNPGSHFIPRVYADGWKSNEDEECRCFVLWFGKKRIIQETDKKHTKEGKYVRIANRLGVSGTSMVFMTRSRQERDLWVLALNNEIESVADAATRDITVS